MVPPVQTLEQPTTTVSCALYYTGRNCGEEISINVLKSLKHVSMVLALMEWVIFLLKYAGFSGEFCDQMFFGTVRTCVQSS